MTSPRFIRHRRLGGPGCLGEATEVDQVINIAMTVCTATMRSIPTIASPSVPTAMS
jgi:hypothetical protein